MSGEAPAVVGGTDPNVVAVPTGARRAVVRSYVLDPVLGEAWLRVWLRISASPLPASGLGPAGLREETAYYPDTPEPWASVVYDLTGALLTFTCTPTSAQWTHEVTFFRA